MKQRVAVWASVLLFLGSWSLASGQGAKQSQDVKQQSATATATQVQEQNVQEYIELLRSDVRQQKSQIMGAVMQLDVEQAATFWPIYSEYDAELTKLNDERVANIQEYSRTYEQMTDAKADELIQHALNFHKQRSDLLAKYYARVKASLGAIQAARFLQIEDQLLMIIDLQIASSLPIVAQGS